MFISDLHLDESRPDVTEAFFSFIKNVANRAEGFYILGDLFEVWLGDDNNSVLNQNIISALKALSVPRFIMHGNRDFLIGKTFCQQTGFTLLPDPTRVLLFDRPVLLMHGDSLCTRDVEYIKVRNILRNPAFQNDLLSKSLQERMVIASGARNQSKEHTRQTKIDIMDVTHEEVISEMQQHEVQLLIHGHTHRPDTHYVPEVLGQRAVLGDWDTQGWFIELTEAGFNLESFSIS
ncbi:MAG: UDP-2,3-diacylglucosamine diphosphatase [Gammaproteobacteria bacterium TMED1]|nr:MAG: UDP-2,3-diacylglucosamine diphosphatase [Gammaproteobacteria bacterium TMED1]